MKRLIILSAIGVLLILTIVNCERKLTGWGDDESIHVLADSTLWESSESLIRDVFEIPIITPQNETIFTIEYASLQKFKRFKNLVFLATMVGNGPVSQLVKNNLSAEAKLKVQQGNYVFIQKEKWASDQLIMFLVSQDSIQLKQKIAENKDYLFNIFDNYWNEAKKAQMYETGREQEIEKKLLAAYGWKFMIPYDYKIFIEKPAENFVMLRRLLPDRWLFIHWIENADPSVLTEQWCIDLRNELGNKFYGGDEIEQKYVQPKVEEVDFLGRNAIKLDGLWRNDEKAAGGPFKNYCFYDEKSNRIYMIDFSIFSPRLKRSKRIYLRQAEIILHTFQTKEEIKPKLDNES